MTITAIGMTPVVQGEDADTELGMWERALAHAEARARKIAAASSLELGPLSAVEEITNPDGREDHIALRVTYMTGSAREHAKELVSSDRDDDSILEHVDVEVRPIYAKFRERLLESEPTLTVRAAPLRKGKRRYEGFRVQSRNVIYAEPRKGRVRLKFELPEGHALPIDEFVRNGGHDWRIVHLSSERQLEGALLLAQETVGRFI